MKINAIPVGHMILVETDNTQYLIRKLKKPMRIEVSVVATSNLRFYRSRPWFLAPQVATFYGVSTWVGPMSSNRICHGYGMVIAFDNYAAITTSKVNDMSDLFTNLSKMDGRACLLFPQYSRL